MYADQPHTHKVCTVCTISIESEHKLTCNRQFVKYMKYNKQRGLLTSELSSWKCQKTA